MQMKISRDDEFSQKEKMMPFEFKKCFADGIEIEGLLEIAPKIFCDERGYFFESRNERDFEAAGIAERFVQSNQSLSTKDVLRGLHFQTRRPQAKLVRAILGQVRDVAVDLRQGSKTFGKHFCVTLDGNSRNELYIPRGFAHGFLVLSETAVFAYDSSDFYDPRGEGALIWNDATLAIDWAASAPACRPLLSEKDKKRPPFDPREKYFDKNGNWIG